VPRLAGRRIARNAIIGAGVVLAASALQGVGAGDASHAASATPAHALHAAPAASHRGR
jgi:hypothetical protein